jgi:hypothetical protein
VLLLVIYTVVQLGSMMRHIIKLVCRLRLQSVIHPSLVPAPPQSSTAIPTALARTALLRNWTAAAARFGAPCGCAAGRGLPRFYSAACCYSPAAAAARLGRATAGGCLLGPGSPCCYCRQLLVLLLLPLVPLLQPAMPPGPGAAREARPPRPPSPPPRPAAGGAAGWRRSCALRFGARPPGRPIPRAGATRRPVDIFGGEGDAQRFDCRGGGRTGQSQTCCRHKHRGLSRRLRSRRRPLRRTCRAV